MGAKAMIARYRQGLSKIPTARLYVWATAALGALIAALSGLDQLLGFFGRPSIETAIASAVIASLFAFVGPRLIRRRLDPDDKSSDTALRQVSLASAILIFGVGIIPFFIQWRLAESQASQGMELLRAEQYAPARGHIEKAADIFSGIGFRTKANDARIRLLTVYFQLGAADRYQELMKDHSTTTGLN